MPLRAEQGISISVAPPPPGEPTGPILAVEFASQEQSNWCWAACCQMVFHFLAVNKLSQCDLASEEFACSCCSAPSSPQCNKPLWPDGVYRHYHVPFVQKAQALTFVQVKEQIDANRPVEAYIEWNGSGAHVILLAGYYDNGDVVVMDPLSDGPARKSLDSVRDADGMGQWTMTYVDLGGRVGV
ncbi:hypothetical protein FJW07_31280 [Mesorhizobium sp. B3-1-9]|nr:hypothetical protein FJW07_31280 [Mesorhizobium sp. B3-1-9]